MTVTVSAVLALAGASALMAGGVMPGTTQHGHHRVFNTLVTVGLALVAAGTGMWLGGAR